MVDDSAVADAALASEGFVIVTGLTLATSAVASEALSFVFYPGGVIAEAGVASDSFTLGPAVRAGVLTEAGAAREAWSFTRILAVGESAAASEAWALSAASGMRETAQASSVLIASAAYHLARVESAAAAETWTFEHTRSLAASASATETWAVSYSGGVAVSDTAFAGDQVSPRRILNVSLIETAHASVSYGLSGAYVLTMVESAVAADWVSPGASVTTWAINTRTQAVTEYQGYVFNSFAQMGRLFVAADAEGLYELDGPSDAGRDVSAKIGGGFFAPNGPKKAGFKGVYLVARGQGSYLVKVVAGDGRYWMYRAKLNPGLMTTKVNVGKGLNAQFYRWELVNEDGQDFDFQSIEFVPMMSGRRVG